MSGLLSAAMLSVGAAADIVTDQIAPLLREGALSFQKDIDLTSSLKPKNWSVSQFGEAVSEAYLYCPELFFTDQSLEMRYDGSSYKVSLGYTISPSQYAGMKQQLDAAVQEVISGITDEMTDVEKALYIHDFIILNCGYDQKGDSFDMYSCLVNGSAVCQGYSLAYMYILKNYLDIDCTIVYSETMNHAWNYVKIGGSWYHVDLTKDDAGSSYKNTSYDNCGFVKHENFLLSDQACRTTSDPHSNWKVVGGYPAATDTRYDKAFWKESNSPAVIIGKTCYFAYKTEETNPYILICSYDFGTDTRRTLVKVNSKWYTVRNSAGTETYPYGKYYYKKCWISLANRGNKLYFNTARSIYSYNLTTGTTKKLYTLDKENNQIFGAVLTDSDHLQVAYRNDITYPEKYVTLKFV